LQSLTLTQKLRVKIIIVEFALIGLNLHDDFFQWFLHFINFIKLGKKVVNCIFEPACGVGRDTFPCWRYIYISQLHIKIGDGNGECGETG